MRITCPHCLERAITRTSKRPVPVFYEVYAQCANPDCGWGGKLHVEFVTTRSPSRRPNPNINIPVEPRARQALLAQLEDE
ncbi:ogr/Delta-like zinc finger family protein [Halomonas pacifica]|uniref:ogr/Delta-like zinc finger family protein n=1 Tax=Bisbaumannia pacifica TaxID=77098 RepID=UPI00235999E9|nr:ogr/Delta-like zinc finger family protein [Halomonas pacifica]MDC8802534.1 ogr/Delta-like zinc finger family protein [Halomonas pacifica]